MSETRKSKQARGSLKEALGKITGDADVEAQGRAEKAAHAPDPRPGARPRPPRTRGDDPGT